MPSARTPSAEALHHGLPGAPPSSRLPGTSRAALRFHPGRRTWRAGGHPRRWPPFPANPGLGRWPGGLHSGGHIEDQRFTAVLRHGHPVGAAGQGHGQTDALAASGEGIGSELPAIGGAPQGDPIFLRGDDGLAIRQKGQAARPRDVQRSRADDPRQISRLPRPRTEARTPSLPSRHPTSRARV